MDYNLLVGKRSDAGNALRTAWRRSKTDEQEQSRRTFCCAFNYHLFLVKFMISHFHEFTWTQSERKRRIISRIKTSHWSSERASENDSPTCPRRQVFPSLLRSFILNFRISFFFLHWIHLSCLLFSYSAYLLASHRPRTEKTRFTSFIFINIHNTLYSTFSPYRFNDSSSRFSAVHAASLGVFESGWRIFGENKSKWNWRKQKSKIFFGAHVNKNLMKLMNFGFMKMISTEWNLLCINLPH